MKSMDASCNSYFLVFFEPDDDTGAERVAGDQQGSLSITTIHDSVRAN